VMRSAARGGIDPTFCDLSIGANAS
jgi:hypothetical protein